MEVPAADRSVGMARLGYPEVKLDGDDDEVEKGPNSDAGHRGYREINMALTDARLAAPMIRVGATIQVTPPT